MTTTARCTSGSDSYRHMLAASLGGGGGDGVWGIVCARFVASRCVVVGVKGRMRNVMRRRRRRSPLCVNRTYTYSTHTHTHTYRRGDTRHDLRAVRASRSIIRYKYIYIQHVRVYTNGNGTALAAVVSACGSTAQCVFGVCVNAARGIFWAAAATTTTTTRKHRRAPSSSSSSHDSTALD